MTYILLTAIIGIIVGIVITITYVNFKLKKINHLLKNSQKEADDIITHSKKEAESIKKEFLLEAKEEWYKTKKQSEKEINERKNELRAQEKKFTERLSNLDKRLDSLDKKESILQEMDKNNKDNEKRIEKMRTEVDVLIKNQKDKLAEIARLTQEEAVNIMMTELKETARNRAANDVRQIVEQAKSDATKKVASILSTAIQRMAVDHSSESTVSVVSLQSDEMKGRIIGREGRNIRAFEKASGVDLIVDDTPEAVVLSCFDPVRREIARLSLEKLILDGRIHPGRIEEVVIRTKKEMDETLVKIGEQACLDTNIHNISPNIIKLLGRLHYRTSYGQNVLQHSIETAWICGIMAAEIGIDQEIARRAGLLHDLGKAVDHEFDGSHAALGANIAKKNGESQIIVNAIAAHHEEVQPESVYAALAQASDAISGSRPGARREMLETYMQRLEKLEEIANSIEGVSKTYAIQAGREIRIIVDPVLVDDNQTVYIANDIAETIEKEMQYPGQIKVTVIRETRQMAVAK
ncbi:MAG: ribonuclease Y [Candidatus Cloacimonetes bacterium]|nr:ribonuclease Y [Candidatus Cloacimonadota bacterium]